MAVRGTLRCLRGRATEMNKWFISSLACLTIPTMVSGQNQPSIYIDCEVIRSYSIPDSRLVKDKLNYKIDTKSSTIYEYDFDKGVYLNKCVNNDGDLKIGQSSGVCVVDEERFFFVNTSEYAFFHNSDSVTIYRASGKIRGDLSMYQGPFKRGEFDPNKRPMVEYKINGTCQQGADLSRAEKAF